MSDRNAQSSYSRFTHHVSRITFHASRFTHHDSLITFHTSRFTHHVSHITFHSSLFTLRSSLAAGPEGQTQSDRCLISTFRLHRRRLPFAVSGVSGKSLCRTPRLR